MTAVPRFIGGCLPSPEQMVFLKACLAEPEEARTAWKKWQEYQPLDAIEGSPFHLLPLLYRNLQRADYREPVIDRLKGLYRRNWYTSQKRFHGLEKIIARFRGKNIPVLLIKGVALSFLYYPDPYSRAMLDGDILVPVERAKAAIAELEKTGWTAKGPYKRNFLRTMHSQSFVNAEGQELDLHWHLFPESSGEKDSQIFWARALPMQFRGEQVLTLSPTDHLFHACIHGYQWNPLNPLRWIADATLILAKDANSIEWDYLVTQACRWRLSLRLRNSLRFLRDECGEAIPDRILEKLDKVPVSGFEYFEHKILTREGRLHHDPFKEFLWPLGRIWCVHRRCYPRHSRLHLVLTYPAAICNELYVSPCRLPLALARSALRKLRLRHGV